MAITVRRIDETLAFITAQAHNLLCAQTALVGSLFHADKTSLTTTDQWLTGTAAVLQVTAANATDLTTCITLMNNISGVLRVHLADGISTDSYSSGAHKIPDTVNTASIPAVYVATGNTATDTAAIVAGFNAQKALLNLHYTQAAPSAVHFTNDGTNTIAAAAATVLADSITLGNAIKAGLNPHIVSAPTTPMIKIIAA